MRKEIEERETYSSTSSRSSTDPFVKSQAFSEESVNDPQSDLSRSEEFSLPELGGDIPGSDEKKLKTNFRISTLILVLPRVKTHFQIFRRNFPLRKKLIRMKLPLLNLGARMKLVMTFPSTIFSKIQTLKGLNIPQLWRKWIRKKHKRFRT